MILPGVLERKTELLGHRLRVATQNVKFDSLSVVPTSLIEGEPEPGWLYFNIRKSPLSSVQVNHAGVSRGAHAIVLMSGGGFVATMPSGFSSYGVGICTDFLHREGFLCSNSLQVLGRTAVYTINECLFRAINRELYLIEHSELREAALENRLGDLTASILTSLDPSDEVGTTNRQRIIYRSIHYIRSTNRRVSPIELAEVAHCSVRTLQYAFRKTYGLSPKQFIDRYRLSQFHEVLVRSPGSCRQRLGDIARVYGFEHAGNLSKAYRELFGQLPSDTVQANQG